MAATAPSVSTRSHVRRVAIALVLPALLLGALVWWRGGPEIWSHWNFPAAPRPFLDARVITAGAESYRMGYDPLVANPADSNERPLNYPRIWHLLFRLGLRDAHGTLFGSVLVTLFAAAVLAFALRHRGISPWWFTAALFSPAIILGIERGNIDLGLFALVVLAVELEGAGRRLSSGLTIFLAGVLKLYPFAAVVAVLNTDRRSSLRRIRWILGAAVLYLLATANDLALIRAATPSATWRSYGRTVAVDVVERFFPDHASLAHSLTTVALALCLALAAWSWWRSRRTPEPTTSPSVIAFRTGAACYIGTFLLGANFDYRLMFVLLALPQLVSWASQTPWRWTARLTLIAFYASLWLSLAESYDEAKTDTTGFLALAVSVTANWILFGGLGGLFAGTLPGWLRFPGPASRGGSA